MSHYNSTESSFYGFITSAFGSAILGFAGDALSAFALGIVGAFGGWLFNKIRRRFEK